MSRLIVRSTGPRLAARVPSSHKLAEVAVALDRLAYLDP